MILLILADRDASCEETDTLKSSSLSCQQPFADCYCVYCLTLNKGEWAFVLKEEYCPPTLEVEPCGGAAFLTADPSHLRKSRSNLQNPPNGRDFTWIRPLCGIILSAHLCQKEEEDFIIGEDRVWCNAQ